MLSFSYRKIPSFKNDQHQPILMLTNMHPKIKYTKQQMGKLNIFPIITYSSLYRPTNPNAFASLSSAF